MDRVEWNLKDGPGSIHFPPWVFRDVLSGRALGQGVIAFAIVHHVLAAGPRSDA